MTRKINGFYAYLYMVVLLFATSCHTHTSCSCFESIFVDFPFDFDDTVEEAVIKANGLLKIDWECAPQYECFWIMDVPQDKAFPKFTEYLETIFLTFRHGRLVEIQRSYHFDFSQTENNYIRLSYFVSKVEKTLKKDFVIHNYLNKEYRNSCVEIKSEVLPAEAARHGGLYLSLTVRCRDIAIPAYRY